MYGLKKQMFLKNLKKVNLFKKSTIFDCSCWLKCKENKLMFELLEIFGYVV